MNANPQAQVYAIARLQRCAQAPGLFSQLQAEAARQGLRLRLIQADLTRWWVPPSHYTLIIATYYLNRDLMPDALHPNEAGYRAWARAMEPTLRQLLDEPSDQP